MACLHSRGLEQQSNDQRIEVSIREHIKKHFREISLKKVRESLKTFKGLTNQPLVHQKVSSHLRQFSESILGAVQKIQECAVGHILITETESLCSTIGVITKRDILMYVIKNFTSDSKVDLLLDEPLQKQTLGTTGSAVVCAQKSDTLRRVFQEIYKNKFSCIPIIDEQRVYQGAINKSHIDFILRESCLHLVKTSDLSWT